MVINLFNNEPWSEHMMDLVQRSNCGKPVQFSFERNICSILRGDQYMCPLCLIPLSSQNILLHLHNHLKPRLYTHPFYSFSNYQKDMAKKLIRCFIPSCYVRMFWSGKRTFRQEIRDHLCTHTSKELKHYGINIRLLQYDKLINAGRDDEAKMLPKPELDKES